MSVLAALLLTLATVIVGVARMFLAHVAGYFPGGQGRTLQSELVCYARSVIHDEWRQMRDERPSARVDGWTDAMQRDIRRVSASTPRAAALYGEWCDQRALRDEGRRERLEESKPFVPSLWWIALITGAVVIVAYLCLFANPDMPGRYQLAIAGAIAGVIALNLCVVQFLDHPYEDADGAISPAAMQQSLAEIESEDGLVRPPCDACAGARARAASGRS